jgi:cell division protein FtsW (lipid II flippase)
MMDCVCGGKLCRPCAFENVKTRDKRTEMFCSKMRWFWMIFFLCLIFYVFRIKNWSNLIFWKKIEMIFLYSCPTFIKILKVYDKFYIILLIITNCWMRPLTD